MTEPRTGSETPIIYIEDGEQVYPCRCGETHRGPYALYDYGHHTCFHESPLIQLGDEYYLCCPECGEVFDVNPEPVGSV